MMRRSTTTTGGVVLAAVFAAGAVRADEGGVSFWLPGQLGSFSAMAPSQGFTLPLVSYHYEGDIGAAVPLPLGNLLGAGLETTFVAQFIVPTWAPERKILGAQPAVSLTIVPARSRSSATISVNSLAVRKSDSVTGFADLFPMAQLFWANGSDHYWMAYAQAGIPVGSYDPNRISNLGAGHGAIDIGGAYTYLNETTGREFSTSSGLTANFRNDDTGFKNGTDWHVDAGIAQFLSEQAFVGVNLFLYQQISDDEGGLSVLKEVRSRVYGVGPQFGYTFMAGDVPIFASIRGFYEFGAVKRVEGRSVFLTVSVPVSDLARASRR